MGVKMISCGFKGVLGVFKEASRTIQEAPEVSDGLKHVIRSGYLWPFRAS